ncbi:uncharacterized protein LOC121860440 [Homarus americanus]|uniref:Putative DM4/DM12 family-like protein 17 n=1 Tax=Homarus americanus TaxID=6706 RepID=A0A8J5N4W6_HOMAM|nr:uncharacterized protein LOC121860440 [Homarus americanus]KAG7173533.1 putative DM4/DM12 family-like protein 17 [Homarus americanus]
MSVSPLSLTRPMYNLQNTFAFNFDTVGQDGQATSRSLAALIIIVQIFLDHFLDKVEKGRSYSEDQVEVYESLASKLTSQFKVEGRACIFRFICELQQHPIGRWTLAGHLLTLLFTPRVVEKDGDAELLKEYLVAQVLGEKENVDCGSLYGSCPFSVFNYFDSFPNTTSTAYTGEEENILVL